MLKFVFTINVGSTIAVYTGIYAIFNKFTDKTPIINTVEELNKNIRETNNIPPSKGYYLSNNIIVDSLEGAIAEYEEMKHNNLI